MNDRNDMGAADEAFAKRAKRRFDESVDGLDGATLSQLNRRRHEALGAGAGFETLGLWVPATGLAAAAVLAIVVMVREPALDEMTPPATATDFEILLDEDSFEMLEDLEFYSWIDTDPAFESAIDSGANVG